MNQNKTKPNLMTFKKKNIFQHFNVRADHTKNLLYSYTCVHVSVSL